MTDLSSAKMHLSLNVTDLERSVRFYEALFGEPAHKRRTGYANFDVQYPPLKLALQEHAVTPSTGPLNHLGVLVEGAQQVQAARDRLARAGLATFDERDTTCCFARQDKVWVTDPDGNGWEIYALLDDMMDAGEEDVSCPTCCPSVAGSVCCG